VSPEIVLLAEDRLLFWNQLRELAGVTVPESVRDALTGQMESEFESRLSVRLRSTSRSWPS
jgi:hypothetical protein